LKFNFRIFFDNILQICKVYKSSKRLFGSHPSKFREHQLTHRGPGKTRITKQRRKLISAQIEGRQRTKTHKKSNQQPVPPQHPSWFCGGGDLLNEFKQRGLQLTTGCVQLPGAALELDQCSRMSSEEHCSPGCYHIRVQSADRTRP